MGLPILTPMLVVSALAGGVVAPPPGEAGKPAPVKVGKPAPAEPIADKFAVERVKLTILGERQGIWPGGHVDVALRFEISPKWHLYWRGQNDSGFAPEVEWKLPKGYTVGETIWPAPKRHISPGDILDHVYYNELVLITTINAPADAKPGASVKFSADVRWLVCDEACVPGSATVTIELPVVAGEGLSSPSPDVELFTLARRAAPKSLIPAKSDKPDKPGWNKAAMPEEPGVFSTRWDGRALVISATDKNARIAFMPDMDSAPAQDLIKSGSSKAGTVRLSFDEADPRKPVMGMVVIVDHNEALKRAYLIKTPLPAPTPESKSAPAKPAPSGKPN